MFVIKNSTKIILDILIKGSYRGTGIGSKPII